MERTKYRINEYSNKSLKKQVGGDHYKKFPIQPLEFCHKNKKMIGPTEAGIIKYTCRHEFKNGAEDIKKAIHLLEYILETDYNENDSSI